MSQEKLDGLQLVVAVSQRRLRWRETPDMLSLSVRQVRRLVWRYRGQRARGLRRRSQGKPLRRAIAKPVRISQYRAARLRDFFRRREYSATV